MEVPIVAIAGGSGSGKTWLARQLVARLGADASHLCLDDFYRDLGDLPLEERTRANFDRPGAIDWPLFLRTLAQIRQGKSPKLPVYDFATHVRAAYREDWKPGRLVILDGLWLLRRSRLRQLCSLRVFVECPDEVRLARRLRRDHDERGRSLESIRDQFQQHVLPMHQRYVQSQAALADVIVHSEFVAERLLELEDHCRNLLFRGQPCA